MSAGPHPTKKSHGQTLTEISEGMVALLKEYYGVGPTQAKTYYQDDLVVAVLRGGFTRVEQTLRGVRRRDEDVDDAEQAVRGRPAGAVARPARLVGSLPDHQPASFETAAARPPQDEELS